MQKRTVTVTHGEENVLGVTPVHYEEQEELTAEPKECVQEVCALTRPTTVTPEEALEETELLQMTPILEIQSMDSIEKTQVVKSLDATAGPVNLQPLEFQQVVEMEIVKTTSGVEEIKENIIEVTEIKDAKGDAEEEMDAISEVEEAKLTNEEVTCLQTELDTKPVTMSSEDSSTTETEVLRRSSRISTATSQRKLTQGGKVGQQEESAHALDKPENEKNTEIISERIRPEQSEIENKEGTSVNFAVDQAEEEDNEDFEELLLRKKQPDVSGTMVEEFEPAEKGKAEKAEVEKIGESENVVVGAEKTGENNKENMETGEGLNECAVLLLSEQSEHMERLQEEEPIRDASVVQESMCEREKETQKSSHDDVEVKSDKWPELTEGDDSEKAGHSGATGRHAKSQSSNYATPLRRSERFLDQYVEGELTRRALRSGTKSVTATSKQRCVQHLKVVKQHSERSQAVGESDTKQKEDVMKPHTKVTETEEQKEEKMDTVSITSEGDGENRTEVEKDVECTDHDLNTVEMAQNDAGQNVATLQQAAVVLVDLNQISPEQIGINETTREISQSQEEAGEEQDKLVSTEEESKEESVVESAEKSGSETSTGTTSLAEVRLNKAEVAEEEMRVEDLTTESLEGQAAELVADKMLITDSEQEESKSAEENKDDAVREITLEEESVATLTGNTAEVCTNENEAPQKEGHESIRPGNEETVQESSPKEETPLITSRSLRRRTVTIKSPPQRKCIQKTGEVTDNTDKGIIKEAEADKDEKIEIEDSAVSKGEDRVQESTDQIEVVQEEEPMKKTEPLEPLNEETVNKDISKPSHGDEEEKSDNRTESIEEKDLDKADDSGLTEEYADSQNSNIATPLRHSQRFKDQPAEDDLTERVLRSGTKSVTTKQMHVQHAKAVKQLKDSMGDPEAEQKKEGKDSHSAFAKGEKMETVTNERQDETLVAVQDSVQEDKVEKEYLEPETADDHVLNEAENKMEECLQNETTRDGQKTASMDLEDSDIVKDTVIQVEGKETQQPVGEPVEKQDREPATEMAQNVVESTSVFILQQAAVVLVDCNKASPQKTDGSDNDETLLSLDRQKCKEEGTVENQTEYLVEQPEKEQTGGSETSTETGQMEDGLNKAKVAEEDDPFTGMGVEEPIKENLVVEMGTDDMPETNSNEEKSMSAEEQVITFEEESGKTADVYISENEKNEKGDQMGTSDHEETEQKKLPEEGTPVVTSRTLRKRTVTVKSPPQQKSKCPKKRAVEATELDNVKMAEVMDIMHKGLSEEKEENKDEKAQDSAVDSAEDQIQKPTVTEQGQMEVVQEDAVKDNSTPQNLPGSEESTIKEVIESRPADESEVSDNNFAEVEKDAEIEDKAQEPTASEPVENQTDETAIEAPGEGEQKAEETTEVVKLQKASVVLVDFNKVSPQVTTEDTLQPQEKACEEPDTPADVSMHIDESKAEEQVMKQTDVQVEPTEKEKAEVQASTAIGENTSTEDISETRDENTDEKMEIEDDGLQEDKGRLPEVVQEKELVKETTTVQEIPCETEVQEQSQADKDKSDSQIEHSKADSTVKQCDNEISEVGTPRKHSRQPVDKSAVGELTTRVLRSSTKQVIVSPNQRVTRHIKSKMHIELIERAADEPEKKREQMLELQADIAEGDKIETVNVAAEAAMASLTSTLEESKVENDMLRAEINEDSESKEKETHPQDENTVDDDIRTKQCSESDQVITEDVVLEEAGEATTGKEIIAGDHVSAIPEDAETEVEGSIAQSVKEQDEALVSETAEKVDGQNAADPALGLTLQNASVVLVDFNKVHPKIISESENTEETSQSQEDVDKQVHLGEDKKESNEDEEMEQTESLVETAEKEQADENKTTETTSQEKEGLNSTVLEETSALAVTSKRGPVTEILEETPMDVGADNTLKTGSEQEESVLAEEKGKDDKVGAITLEEEPAATVSEEVAAVKKGVNQAESVQEGLSEEETPIITSRSLRRRTITVKSSLQIKQVQKSCVQEEMKKAEVDKETDVNKAEKTPSVCISVEVKMPKTNPEDSNADGKVTSEMEKQEQISEQQEALIAEEIPEAELKLSEDMADEGNAIINEREDKEKGEMPSETAVSIEVEDIMKEEERVLSTENTEGGEMVSVVQDSAAQEKELEMLTGSTPNVVAEGITQSEEREMEKNEEEDSSRTSLSKPAQGNTEEETSDEEEELIFTKNLRRRTVTVQTPLRRKHKHLNKEVVDTYTETPQPEKGELSREPSNERKTVESSEEPITAVEEKNESMITETDSKEESGDAQVSSEEISEEIVTIDKHEDKNTAETHGEMEQNIADQEKERMEERTENDRDREILEEDTDVIENNLEKEPEKADEVETVNANPEQEKVLDIAEGQLLEETSERESRILEEEKEEKGKMSTKEEFSEVEEEVGVTRRSLRKRTITMKATPKRKSKRLRKQDQDVHLAEDPLPADEPVMALATVESHAEKQATETQATSQEQCDSDNEREMLSEKSQEQDNPEGEEAYGETSPEKEGDQQAQELISASTEETDTKTEAQDRDKGEVEEHENKSTEKGDKTSDTVQDVEEKNGMECSEISPVLDEGFTLELDEEDEDGPEKTNLMRETEASLIEQASTSIQKMDRHEEHVTDQTAMKRKQVLQESSSTAAPPDQSPTRWSKRFLRESQGEMEDTVAVIEEDEEKKTSQQKRKAIVDLTPRRSKRLARPKI